MKLDHLSQPIQTSGSRKETYGFEVCSAAFEALSSTIYTHMVIANIREYVSNAIDAHTVAGRAYQPVEVTLPTIINPAYIVKDFGDGLSDESMWDVFAVFFKTTKESCNESIGGFGLGAKCALYYSRSFTISSIHKGIKSVYCSYVNEENIPDLTLISSHPTDEHSGLTINVPVDEKDFHKFHQEASIILSMFETRPIVHTAGFEFAYDDIHEQIKENGFALINKVSNSDLYSRHDAYALVGGVIYPVPSDCSATNTTHFNLMTGTKYAMVVPFDIADVKPVLSREAIKVTHEVVELINDKINDIVATYIEDIQHIVDLEPTIINKAIKAYSIVGERGADSLGIQINGRHIRYVRRKELNLHTIMKCRPAVIDVYSKKIVGVHTHREVLQQIRLTINAIATNPNVIIFYKDVNNSKTQFMVATKKYIRSTFKLDQIVVIIDPRWDGVNVTEEVKQQVSTYLSGNCTFVEYDEYNDGYYNPPKPRISKPKSTSRGVKKANTLYCRFLCDTVGATKIAHHELDPAYQYVWSDIEYVRIDKSLWPNRKPIRIIKQTRTNLKRLTEMGIPSLAEYCAGVAQDYQDYHEYTELNNLFMVEDGKVFPYRGIEVFKYCAALRKEFRTPIRRFNVLRERYERVRLSNLITQAIPRKTNHTEHIDSIVQKYNYLNEGMSSEERIKTRLKVESQYAKIVELQKLLSKGKTS